MSLVFCAFIPRCWCGFPGYFQAMWNRHISLLIAPELSKSQLFLWEHLHKKNHDSYILQCRLMCFSHVALVCFPRPVCLSSHMMNCLFVWWTPFKGLSDQLALYFRWMMNNVKRKEDFKINDRHQSGATAIFCLCAFYHEFEHWSGYINSVRLHETTENLKRQFTPKFS